jgi:beta-lactamase superfamily II metal-dependent hydrolase
MNPSYANVVISAALTVLLYADNVLADMEVHFIDVEQGGAVLVQKNNMTVLYDCGERQNWLDCDGLSWRPRRRQNRCLDRLACPQRPYGWLCPRPEQHRREEGLPQWLEAKTKTWRQFLKTIRAKSEAQIIDRDIKETDWLEIIIGYDRTKGHFGKEADNGILARVVDDKIKVLLIGDCEQPCEKEVIQSPVQSDVLSVGHHGSKYSSSAPFLDKVMPKVAVIQAGARNQYGHPTADALQRLKDAGVSSENLYRTDKQSSIVVISDGQTIEVQTEK